MIHEKLLKFKSLNITIEKDATNPFFKNKYTSLNEVLEKVQKPLADMEVVIVQRGEISPTSGTTGLMTELIDVKDGTKIESFIPYVGATDMQKLGGAITYARRYALIAMLGLEDEDDDGNTASATPKKVKGVQDAVGDPLKDNFTI